MKRRVVVWVEDPSVEAHGIQGYEYIRENGKPPRFLRRLGPETVLNVPPDDSLMQDLHLVTSAASDLNWHIRANEAMQQSVFDAADRLRARFNLGET